MNRSSINALKENLRTWTRKYFLIQQTTIYIYSTNTIVFFLNNLNSIIFGADAYRAFKEQKNYLMNQIVKPFGISVEAAFRRVEVIARMMEYFPPPCSNGKEPSRQQWNKFMEIKKLSEEDKREIKYNLLPQSFRDRIDDSNEDWTEWNNVKFLRYNFTINFAICRVIYKRLVVMIGLISAASWGATWHTSTCQQTRRQR